VGASGEEITSERGDIDVLITKPVNAVDDE
jgi:hypothetical protein